MLNCIALAKPLHAAPSNAMALKPEVLSAKAFLEEMLVRRYSLELATQVERSSFNLGAQLDLTDALKTAVAKPKVPLESDTPPDLELGTLDPEALIKSYSSDSETIARVQTFLKDFRIRAVTVSVGLKSELSPEVKTQVEKWLKTRVETEFGKAGKSTVSLISSPGEKPKPVKTLLDRLEQFQGLAGQLVLALAILLGAILWRLLSPPQGESTVQSEKLPPPPQPVPLADAQREPLKGVDGPDPLSLSAEIDQLSYRLAGLFPNLTEGADRLIRTWCQAGEDGLQKLACFAEAVGKDSGKLPVPIDAIQEVTKIFAQMPELGLREKRDTLKKVYWDLLLAVNLGPESLEQPFDYLGAVNINLVKQTLMDQNPKMRTLVALYMPEGLRQDYFKSLSGQSKRDLLLEAAGMSEIETDTLRSIDSELKDILRPGRRGNVVSLEMSLNKIVAAMSPLEQVQILSEMRGGAFETFKRTTPSVAFLGEWSDDSLSILLGRTMPDELTVYLRLKPELQDRFIGLAPSMTAEVASDELSRPDHMKETEKNGILATLANRIRDMIERKEIRLEDAFPPLAGSDGQEGDPGTGAATENYGMSGENGGDDDSDQAA